MARPERGRVDLDALDASDTRGIKRRQAEKTMLADEEHVMNLQDRLHAESKRAVLIVLQGPDTAGKDGTIRYALRGFNPQGVRVVPFKAPTENEKQHSFLWRIKRKLPAPGEIVVFNRSHYEDVLIARVRGLASPKVINERYEQINRFEESLAKSGTTIVKLCLNISEDEQRRRLLARLNDPDKQWKFSEADIAERPHWDAYHKAYGAALGRCSTPTAPWYVIPANRKWYRNWAVTQILIETMEDMKPAYPRPNLDVGPLKKHLEQED